MADNFTPEEISEILKEFFDVVGTRQYIGARYVPVFGRQGEDSIAWDNSAPYEPLTIVTYEGNSYTSRTYVPTGVDITNAQYWALTGNYWAQIEQYRQEVEQYDGRITTNANGISDINGALPIANFNDTNTVKKYVDDSVKAVADVLPSTDFDDTNTVKKYVDDSVKAATDVLPSSEFDDTNTVKKYVDDSVKELADVLPSTDFDDTNTVKKYVDDSIEVVDDAIDELALNVNGFESANVSPLFLGAFAEQTPDTEGHGGGVASNDLFQVHIASRSDSTDMGTVTFINIDSNNSRYLPPKQVLMGHANSICWYPENNVFIIAPEFSYAGGDAQQWKELLVYSSDFNTLTRVATPVANSSLQSVSYDWVTEKLYGLGIDNKVYEISSLYEFTEIGEIMRQNVYNQDFAVYDGIFYNSSPNGFMKYGRIDTCEILGYFTVNNMCSNMLYAYGELNGMEFDEQGHLLCCGDCSPDAGQTDWGLVYTIFQIPLKESPIFFPTTEPDFMISNPNYRSFIINASVFKLRGLTLQHPNLLALWSKMAGPYVQIHIASNITVGFFFALFNNTEIRFDSNYTLECEVLTFAKNLLFFGAGTVTVGELRPFNRAPNLNIDSNVTLVSKNGTNAEIAPSFTYGARVVNAGAAQNSAKIMGTNLTTYRAFENNRATTYLIS